MLKKIRIILATISIIVMTIVFGDFYGWFPKELSLLADWQFLPALLALNGVVLVSLLLLTFLFGRIYCSVICPLGIFQDLIIWLNKKLVKKKKRYKYKLPENLLRYGFLLLLVLAVLIDFHFIVGLLDPYSSFGRITVSLFKPVYMAANNLLVDILSNPGTLYRATIFWSGLITALIAFISLAVILIMSVKRGRLYCNTICPVGTFLGLISRFSLFKIHFDTSKCTQCSLCAANCKSECIDYKHMSVDMSRCIDCFDCLPVCRESGIRFGIPKAQKNIEADSSKRRFLMMSALVVAGGAKLLASNSVVKVLPKKIERKTPIMPPGAVDLHHFSSNCTSCHLCVSKCPSHIIKPSLMEYGVGGIMQPVLNFENGFCNYDCTDCGDVCPTSALKPLTKEQKNHTQMGKVQLDLNKCIVVKDHTNCGACSEHCPTQAVSMKDWKLSLTIPHIDQSICVGCGGCEYVCPATPVKAIYVEGLTVQNQIVIKKRIKEEVVVDDFGF